MSDCPLSSLPDATAEHWTARFSRPVIFVILTLVAVGAYLAYTIPVAVFPETDFPRILVGIGHRVAPLNHVSGVAMVVVQGGKVPEFQIEPDPANLCEAQVTVPSILDAITKTNMIDSPGLIENNHELSLTLVTGQTRDLAQIANIVVRTTPSGVPVRIGDIATVHPSIMPVYTMVTANGKPAVLLNIFRQPASNTVAVADLLTEEINQIRKTLPSCVKVQPFYDQSTPVSHSIAIV